MWTWDLPYSDEERFSETLLLEPMIGGTHTTAHLFDLRMSRLGVARQLPAGAVIDAGQDIRTRSVGHGAREKKEVQLTLELCRLWLTRRIQSILGLQVEPRRGDQGTVAHDVGHPAALREVGQSAEDDSDDHGRQCNSTSQAASYGSDT